MNAPGPLEIYMTFAGVIDQQATQRIFGAFAQAINNHFGRVHLLVQSGGGGIEDGIAIYNYLRNLPLEIITYNCGGVSSIAVLIYLAGKPRRATADATFMLHRTTTNCANATVDELESFVASGKLHNANTEAILRRHLKVPEGLWAHVDRGASVTISGQEALDYGFCHEFAPFAPPPGACLINI
jgi:ATP-dependent Clp protease, protease subunit